MKPTPSSPQRPLTANGIESTTATTSATGRPARSAPGAVVARRQATTAPRRRSGRRRRAWRWCRGRAPAPATPVTVRTAPRPTAGSSQRPRARARPARAWRARPAARRRRSTPPRRRSRSSGWQPTDSVPLGDAFQAGVHALAAHGPPPAPPSRVDPCPDLSRRRLKGYTKKNHQIATRPPTVTACRAGGRTESGVRFWASTARSNRGRRPGPKICKETSRRSRRRTR